ncbi:hypothetical protein, partial [Klebsiella pneumoniae]|uniref:hypothetical protein n=1 Tax=Klebsiella pneumoniae TaxID=573 RepID=UPI0039C4C5FC
VGMAVETLQHFYLSLFHLFVEMFVFVVLVLCVSGIVIQMGVFLLVVFVLLNFVVDCSVASDFDSTYVDLIYLMLFLFFICMYV